MNKFSHLQAGTPDDKDEPAEVRALRAELEALIKLPSKKGLVNTAPPQSEPQAKDCEDWGGEQVPAVVTAPEVDSSEADVDSWEDIA